MMQLEKIVLHEIEMPLKQPFISSLGQEKIRRFLIIETAGHGQIGYGEVAVLTHPTYNEGTASTAWHILETYLVPIALRTEWETPEQLSKAFQPVRRHHMAKAGLESAVWDLYAKQHSLSLSQALGGRRAMIEAGVAIGIEHDIKKLTEIAKQYIQQGYRRIKVKIMPGWDQVPLNALRDSIGDFPLMADANSSYTLQDFHLMQQLDPLGLMMIEQPFAEDDLLDHAKLQAALSTPVCLDEGIVSLSDARQAIELESCQIINIKSGRVGGLCIAKRLHDFCAERHIPVWCGGMLESGIGRAHNIALASLPNFCLPADLSASNRYWHEDIIEPEIEINPDGTVTVPQLPGIGVQVNAARLERFTLRRKTFTPGRQLW